MFVLKFQDKMRSKNCYYGGFEMSGDHCNLVGCVQCKLHLFLGNDNKDEIIVMNEMLLVGCCSQ